MKKLIMLIMVSLLMLTGCNSNKKENREDNSIMDETGEMINNSHQLNEEKSFYGYKINNINLKTEDGVNMLTATIENVSGNYTEQGVYNIVFTDKNENEISKISIFIKALSPNEKLEIKSSINLDVIDSYNFKLEK